MSRKIMCTCIIILCILSGLILQFPAIAEGDWSASLQIEQLSGVEEDGTVNVRISVSDITVESGIICAIYHVYYDTSVFELISWENGKPDSWDFSGSSAFGAEDWTTLLTSDNGESYLMYTLMNTTMKNGVTDDGILYTDLKFKVLKEEPSSKIRITDISFLKNDLNDLENDCELPDREYDLKLSKDTSVVSSDTESSTASQAQSNHEVSSSAESDTESLASSTPAENGNPPASESSGKRVTMIVTVEDIKDEAGVSSLQFTLNYNPLLLQFVEYGCITPESWDLSSAFTEDNSEMQPQKGELMFCIMNHEPGNGVKINGTLGFRIVFETKNTEFDPSLITMNDISLINDMIEDMGSDSYRLSVRYEDENGMIGDDAFRPAENDGKITAILIVAVASAAILGVACCAFVIIRKKKLS